jgi:Protein of unknown function (DUF4239)
MSGSGPPLWLLVSCVVAVAIVIAVGCVLLASRLLSGVGELHNPAMSPFVAIVGLVYGALLGFTVVATWQEFSATEAIVASEASALTTMYRQTVAMPEPERPQLQQLLRQYATAVAGSESNKQAGDGARDSARGAITQMYRIVGSQSSAVASSAINAQFLGQLTVLASDRTQRIIDTTPRIPPLLWAGLIFGGVVLVALTGFLRLASTIGHALVSSAVAVLLGLLLCIVFSLDHPFETDHGIAAQPFQHALQVFDAVDRGT